MAKPRGRKRRESWGMVDTLPSGRIRARYTGPDGQRHNAPMTFDTMTDARGWLAQERARVVAGKWEPPKVRALTDAQRTLDGYARHWVTTRTGRSGAPLRDTTRHGYLALLDGPLAPLGEVPVANLTPALIRSWFSALTATGRLTTAARAYGLLRSVLGTAVVDGILPTNPCAIRGAQNATTGKRVEPPTDAELTIIAANMPDHLLAALVISAWGALRYGELTELRRRDLTDTGDTVLIRIERAVTRVPGNGFHVGPPKSEAGVRVVAMPPQTRQAIIDHLDRYAQPGPDGLLFPARNGGHLAESTFTKSWYKARAAADRDDLPWHALRHFGGTRYAQTGATLREIMARLGHSSPRAALRYQHTAGRDTELAARMMGD